MINYHPNAAKPYLIVKLQLSELYDFAKQLFRDTNAHITCHGQHHLGSAIGTPLFTEECFSKKVKVWSDEILTLSSIAETHPHSAYCACVHDVVPK